MEGCVCRQAAGNAAEIPPLVGPARSKQDRVKHGLDIISTVEGFCMHLFNSRPPVSAFNSKSAKNIA